MQARDFAAALNRAACGVARDYPGTLPLDVVRWSVGMAAKQRDGLEGRDAYEKRMTRELGKALEAQMMRLLELLGDPPNIDNVTAEFWDEAGAEASEKLRPLLTDIYLDDARQTLNNAALGVDWAEMNRAAVEWASRYAFDLVKGINSTSRDLLKGLISDYYRAGMTQGELTDRLRGSFGDVRAEMIAVTEVTRAASEGEMQTRDELEGEGIEMVPVWHTNRDDLVCPICGPLDGQRVGKNNIPPAHPRCLPGDALVLPVGLVAAGSKRWYQGDMVIIETLENKLTVTPNHPILTPGGWVAAGELRHGDYVICYGAGEWETALVEVDNQNVIAAIKNIFGSLGIGGLWVPVTAPDFHGDGSGSNVAVIRPNSKIVHGGQSDFTEPVTQDNLTCGDVISQTALAHPGSQAKLGEWDIPTASSFVSGADLASALLGGHALPLDRLGGGLRAGIDTSTDQPSANSPSVDPIEFSDAILALSSKVAPYQIVNVNRFDFRGHVYNLQTETGLYVADGIITHNCRCWLSLEFKD